MSEEDMVYGLAVSNCGYQFEIEELNEEIGRLTAEVVSLQETVRSLEEENNKFRKMWPNHAAAYDNGKRSVESKLTEKEQEAEKLKDLLECYKSDAISRDEVIAEIDSERTALQAKLSRYEGAVEGVVREWFSINGNRHGCLEMPPHLIGQQVKVLVMK